MALLSYLLSLLLLVLLLPYSTTAQTSSSQSLGSSLIAQEKGYYWAFPFGDFAFGFQQIGNGDYLLAIWFNKILEKTVVWSANGDNLVPTGSKVELTKEGDLEFKAEISAIGRTNHRNLVQLLGYCIEGQHRLLVYEFMSNGSVANFLFGGSRPFWYQRIQIALETTRELFYLHEECSTQIIHCDIKPQNILLDDSSTARISDFGLGKLLKTDLTCTTTGIRGTKGYVAPEWFRNMPITIMVDVCSFGILLLEPICCRKSFEAEAEDEDQMILADWPYDCYKDKKLDLLVENDEEATDDMKRVKKYVMIAIWCS